MAPEIVDLTGNEEVEQSIIYLNSSRSEANRTKLQAQCYSKPAPSTPSKEELATFKSPTLSSSWSSQVKNQSNPRTPPRQTPPQSWDESIPLSLRKDKESYQDLDRIDPLLRSPLSGRSHWRDSGIGESMSGSDRSSQEHPSMARVAKNIIEHHTREKPPTVQALTDATGLSRNPTLNQVASTIDKSRESESFVPTNLAAGIKRKWRSEHALKSPSNDLDTSLNIQSEQAEISKPRSLSSADTSSNPMYRGATSITPYVPTLRKSATRSQKDESPRELSSGASTSQQRALNDRQSHQKMPFSNTNATTNREKLSTENTSSAKITLKPSEVAIARTVPLSTSHTNGSSARISTNSAKPHHLGQNNNWDHSAFGLFQTPAHKTVLDAMRPVPQTTPRPSISSAPREAALPSLSLPQRLTSAQPDRQLPTLQPIVSQKAPNKTLSPYSYSIPAPEGFLSQDDASSEGEVEMKSNAHNERSLPPGFDRGRFPMQRRRRGDKKFAPSRIGSPIKSSLLVSHFHAHPPAPKQSDSHTAASLHLSNTSLSDEKIRRDPPLATLSKGSHSLGKLYLASRTSTCENPSESLPSPADRLSHPMDLVSEFRTGSTAVTGNEIQENLAWSSSENDRVTKFYFTVLGPAIKRIKKRFKHRLSEAELDEVGKSVSVELVTNNLLYFLRQNGFTTNKPQRKKIRKQIGHLYKEKVNLALQRRRGEVTSLSDRKVMMRWSIIPPKTMSSASSLSDSTNCPIDAKLHNQNSEPIASSPFMKSRHISKTEISQNENDFQFHQLSPKIPSKYPLNQSKHLPLPQSAAHHVSLGDTSIFRTDETFGEEQQPFELRQVDPSYPTIGRHPPDITTRPGLDGSNSEVTGEYPFWHHPRISFDPHLERLIAEAALSPPSASSEGDYPRITREDQLLLLEDNYVVKSTSHQRSRLTAVQGHVVDPTVRPERQLPALLRKRELGLGQQGRCHEELQLRSLEQLRPWRKWKGASSDIVTVTWAPDSLTYAIGAAAHTNNEDLQYNRPCNLLLGELTSNHLWELSNHRTRRPPPSTIAEGYNSIQETYNACDPMVYQTVNSIAFSPDGCQMYTASRDHTVKVWDTSEGQKKCTHTLDHGSVVAAVDVAHVANMRVFATASQSIEDSIRVYCWSDDTISVPISLSSSRAELKPSLRILPECIRWGPTPQNRHLLLAGFSQWDHLGPAERAKEGQLCIWDLKACQSLKITPSSQSVTTVTWHPTLPFFAAGGTPGGGLKNRRQATKTVVRTYDPRSLTRYAMEYESTALDIQDITFHPLDTNIVTAGCTDGTSYVWDYRWPEKPLHRLCHGEALMELDHAKPREEVDTGVLLSLWGPEGSLYYSGSSDGVVKAWDIRRHPLDVHVRDVAQVGAAIQDGAFSPDFSHLLVGDADGGVSILSSAPCGPPLGDDFDDSEDDWAIAAPIQLVRAPDGSGRRLHLSDDNPGTEGIKAAGQSLASGQLEIHPIYGVGKGPNYQGPYAKDQRATQDDGGFGHLNEDLERLQVFDMKGRLNELQAAFRKAHIDRRRWEFYDRMARSHAAHDHQTVLTNRNIKVTETPLSQQEAQNRTNPLSLYSTSKGIAPDKAKEVTAKAQARRTTDKEDMKSAIDNTIPEGEMVEENFWWSRMGEEEILKASATK